MCINLDEKPALNTVWGEYDFLTYNGKRTVNNKLASQSAIDQTTMADRGLYINDITFLGKGGGSAKK